MPLSSSLYLITLPPPHITTAAAGQTPLHEACWAQHTHLLHNYTHIVRLLLANGKHHSPPYPNTTTLISFPPLLMVLLLTFLQLERRG